MKPFDLEAAKAGKPVVTRDGRPVRILCFDMKHDLLPIVALVEYKDDKEDCYNYTLDGNFDYRNNLHSYDLFMAPEKKEYWTAVYKAEGKVYCNISTYPSEQHLLDACKDCKDLIKVIKIHEEEV